jgi:hypothetical protein
MHLLRLVAALLVLLDHAGEESRTRAAAAADRSATEQRCGDESPEQDVGLF